MGGLKDWRRAKMTEYIEREAFKAEIRRLSTHYLNEWDTLGVLAAADRIPAADVRPVTLCRDCKHNNACLTQAFVEDESKVPFDRNTFFCADGKRADDA
jgi:hypothetical protein